MKKRILAMLLVITAVLSVSASADNYDKVKEIDPMNNELFEIVGEVSEEEYFEVEYSVYTDSGALNTQSPYYHLYQGLRDTEKFPYNDGIKRDYYTYTETFELMDVDGTITEETRDYRVSGLYDMNGNCIYTDPVLETSAMSGSYVYNLGYIVHTLVNWTADGNMLVNKIFQNTVINEKYEFFVSECTELLNDGTFYFKYNEKYYKAQLKKPAIVTVFLDGKKIYFDQIPVIENGRTLVPVRAIFEAIGATIDWNGETQTVTATKDDIKISLTVNEKTATKNGEEITLEVPAKIISGRTLVPVRFVADCFGVKVDWDSVMKKVLLNK